MGIEILIGIIIIIFKVLSDTSDSNNKKRRYTSSSNYNRTTINSQKRKQYNSNTTQNNYFSKDYNPNKPETVNEFIREIEEENGENDLTKDIKEAVETKTKKEAVIMATVAPTMKAASTMKEPEIKHYEDSIEKAETMEEVKPVSSSSPADRIKFTILTLVYVMYEDDGEFSRKEKKLVQSVVKVVGRRLSTKDKKELEDILEMRPNLDYLFMKVDDYDMSPEEVFSVIKELRNTVKSEQYTSIFSRIENRMTYEL